MTLMTKEELGDYQTPLEFCEVVCNLLSSKYKINPKYVLEPTTGIGNFLFASSKKFDAKLYGIEINHDYVIEAKKKICNAKIFESNIFTFDFQMLKDEFLEGRRSELLFIGNPPWVTNSELSSIESYNLPLKDNFKKEKGFDAVTGKGNFDICEYILLQLMSEFSNYESCYLAFLCKEIVAKNIVRDLQKYNFNLEFADLYSFNANDVFGVSCDAVLFVTKITKNASLSYANVYTIDDPNILISRFGWKNGVFVSDIDSYNDEIDGKSQLIWRQGIKHDCSKVMEISFKNGSWFNKYGEEINFIDSDFVFPLVKSSDFKSKIINSFKRMMIVTQRYVREDTSSLNKDPRVLNYLNSYKEDFDRRKSIIYKNTPPFSIFGVGDYSFLRYKIGLSGFYKEPQFSFLVSDDKPVMTDDTCYFVGSNNKKHAEILFSLLDDERTYSFLKSISFKNSKRPFTKDVLQRLDFLKMVNKYGYESIVKKTKTIFNETITFADIDSFIQTLETVRN